MLSLYPTFLSTVSLSVSLTLSYPKLITRAPSPLSPNFKIVCSRRRRKSGNAKPDLNSNTRQDEQEKLLDGACLRGSIRYLAAKGLYPSGRKHNPKMKAGRLLIKGRNSVSIAASTRGFLFDNHNSTCSYGERYIYVHIVLKGNKQKSTHS